MAALGSCARMSLMTESTPELKCTPLHPTHVALGARIAPFAGWEMPVQYAGILDEARAVRSGVGIFDVSHMGRIEISGVEAAIFLDRIVSFSVASLRVGRAKYVIVCNQAGGIIDDCILYRLGEERFLLVPNAANTSVVLDWLSQWRPQARQVRIEDVTSSLAMLAHQGPGAREILQGLTKQLDLSNLRPFGVAEATVVDARAIVSRTGYTGEDGFEIILPSDRAADVWEFLTSRGAIPCGLGARDVLRLEAGLLLHGSDMDSSINPYEAGLSKFIDPDREEYVAGKVLRGIREEGPERVLMGFHMVGRGIARNGYAILSHSEQIGHVSSGSYSPTLDRAIGLGYVPSRRSAPGTRFQIDIRGRLVEAETTTLPFYSRRRSP